MASSYSRVAMLCLLLSPVSLNAQGSALTIGDTIPQATLRALKLPSDKFIVLDFWGRYCSSCIKALPELDRLQKQFKGQLNVITIADFQHQDSLQQALHRFIRDTGFSLQVWVSNNTLSQLFPHIIVSHIVWLAPGGIIKAITGAEYITKENIQTVLSGKDVNWPVKQDAVDFDYKAPLLSLTSTGVFAPPFLYYSALLGHIDGIAPPSGIFSDSVNGYRFACFYNYTVSKLCRLAVNYDGRHNGKISFQGNLDLTGTYCYYLRVPLSVSEQNMGDMIQGDLQRWLGIMGVYIHHRGSDFIISENKTTLL